CPRALEHYYLQLKDNFLDQWASRHSVSEERCWEMAALALKVDKGNNPGGYFRAEQYFPIWVIDVRGLEYVRKYMPAASEDLKDMSRVEAMMKFAFEASRSPFALNCHLYGLRRHKMDTVDNAVLGINAKGIEMCDIGDDGERIPLRSLPWNRVTRLSFDRKKLTIVGADTTKMCLYAQSESKARYLLELCRAVHQTLLVLSHQNGKIAPLPQLFQEKSVDRVSTSSTNTTVPNNCEIEKDSDSLLRDSLSSSGDRGQGSVSSKQRVRIKLDSNLDLKIEKMELE
ncbi:FERM PH-like domain protein, partial [Teladorsagia circumcincta]